MIVAAVATYVAINRGGAAPDEVPSSTKSVAILPLQVIGGASDEAHLGVGIADAIITRLAGVRQLALRPTTAVLPYANQSPDPAQVGAALNVEQVIVGTIQPTAATYRVSLQLVRAAGRTYRFGSPSRADGQRTRETQTSLHRQHRRLYALRQGPGVVAQLHRSQHPSSHRKLQAGAGRRARLHVGPHRPGDS